jgi:hypothetical protein
VHGDKSCQQVNRAIHAKIKYGCLAFVGESDHRHSAIFINNNSTDKAIVAALQ